MRFHCAAQRGPGGRGRGDNAGVALVSGAERSGSSGWELQGLLRGDGVTLHHRTSRQLTLPPLLADTMAPSTASPGHTLPSAPSSHRALSTARSSSGRRTRGPERARAGARSRSTCCTRLVVRWTALLPRWTEANELDAVNAIAWAPHELGPILACASSDGKVSVLTFNSTRFLSPPPTVGLFSPFYCRRRHLGRLPLPRPPSRRHLRHLGTCSRHWKPDEHRRRGRARAYAGEAVRDGWMRWASEDLGMEVSWLAFGLRLEGDGS